MDFYLQNTKIFALSAMRYYPPFSISGNVKIFLSAVTHCFLKLPELTLKLYPAIFFYVTSHSKDLVISQQHMH